jgi:hypothetical protein
MSMHNFTAIFVKNQSTMRLEVITKEINSLYGTNAAEARKLQLRPLQIMCENIVFMLVSYREIVSLVITSILIVWRF